MKKRHIIMFFIIEIIIIIFIIIFLQSGISLPECYFYKNYNILCPSCGATRCVINFFRGNLTQALKYNIIYFSIILYLILLNVILILNLLFKHKIKFMYPKLKYIYFFVILILVYFVVRNIF